jgi:hypothetical protein
MIKHNEIRIGSLISIGGIVTQVEGFCIWDFLVQSSKFAERHISEFEPIPLTEEWLVKFGFENKKGFLTLGLLSCVWGEEEACFYFYYAEDKNNEIKVRYIHYLQNLYFALTGEELILNQ